MVDGGRPHAVLVPSHGPAIAHVIVRIGHFEDNGPAAVGHRFAGQAVKVVVAVGNRPSHQRRDAGIADRPNLLRNPRPVAGRSDGVGEGAQHGG